MQISFEYNGRQHSGQIISSTDAEPHYYWLYFDDDHISSIINEDCIGFKKVNDRLQPTRIFTAHSDLIEMVKDIVERKIF